MKLTELANELGKSFEEVMAVRMEKVKNGCTGTGKNTWLNEKAQADIRLAFEVPLAVSSKIWVKGIRQPRNPRWLFCKSDGIDHAIPVLMPNSKSGGRMLGKRFIAEGITDASNSVTYRYSHAAS
jgi:hypothetical protein